MLAPNHIKKHNYNRW